MRDDGLEGQIGKLQRAEWGKYVGHATEMAASIVGQVNTCRLTGTGVGRGVRLARQRSVKRIDSL